jgi:flagellar biogenesis protein FliO
MCIESGMKKVWPRSRAIAGVVWMFAAAATVLALVAAASWAAPTTTSAPAGFMKDFGREGNSDNNPMWRMVASILVVIALGVLAFVVVKRLLPRIKRVSGKRVSVLETTYIGPRKAVHLVQVGSRKLLLASSSDRVVKLDDVTGAFPADYAEVARRVGEEVEDARDADTAAPNQ